jgi:hypothetical protein
MLFYPFDLLLKRLLGVAAKLVTFKQAVQGIRLKRDKWVSVRYAEELNAAKSSVILQRTDRHGILGQKRPDFQVSL